MAAPMVVSHRKQRQDHGRTPSRGSGGGGGGGKRSRHFNEPYGSPGPSVPLQQSQPQGRLSSGHASSRPHGPRHRSSKSQSGTTGTASPTVAAAGLGRAHSGGGRKHRAGRHGSGRSAFRTLSNSASGSSSSCSGSLPSVVTKKRSPLGDVTDSLENVKAASTHYLSAIAYGLVLVGLTALLLFLLSVSLLAFVVVFVAFVALFVLAQLLVDAIVNRSNFKTRSFERVEGDRAGDAAASEARDAELGFFEHTEKPSVLPGFRLLALACFGVDARLYDRATIVQGVDAGLGLGPASPYRVQWLVVAWIAWILYGFVFSIVVDPPTDDVPAEPNNLLYLVLRNLLLLAVVTFSTFPWVAHRTLLLAAATGGVLALAATPENSVLFYVAPWWMSLLRVFVALVAYIVVSILLWTRQIRSAFLYLHRKLTFVTYVAWVLWANPVLWLLSVVPLITLLIYFVQGTGYVQLIPRTNEHFRHWLGAPIPPGLLRRRGARSASKVSSARRRPLVLPHEGSSAQSDRQATAAVGPGRRHGKRREYHHSHHKSPPLTFASPSGGRALGRTVSDLHGSGGNVGMPRYVSGRREEPPSLASSQPIFSEVSAPRPQRASRAPRHAPGGASRRVSDRLRASPPPLQPSPSPTKQQQQQPVVTNPPSRLSPTAPPPPPPPSSLAVPRGRERSAATRDPKESKKEQTKISIGRLSADSPPSRTGREDGGFNLGNL